MTVNQEREYTTLEAQAHKKGVKFVQFLITRELTEKRPNWRENTLSVILLWGLGINIWEGNI